MGFSLEVMIKELREIMDSDKKAGKKLKELDICLAFYTKYAKECGQLAP